MAQKTIDFENDILRPIGSLKRGLADLDDNKITKFYTNNNGDTVLNDSDDGKIQDLMIYGKSEQKQYKGINLFNYARETETNNGITYKYDEETQTYIVNGTATEESKKYIKNISENTFVGKKIVGCPSGGLDGTYCLVVSYLDSTGVWKSDSVETGNGCIIEDFPKIAIYILVRNGVTANNLVFKPMIVEDTTKTYDDFEPYVGGKPSPSPEYPQEIKAVVNPVIKTHGKNLVDFRKAKGGVGGGVTFTVNADGSINVRGTANDSVGNIWILGAFRVTEPADKDVIITLKKGKTYYINDCILFGVKNGSAVSYENIVKPISEDIKIVGIRNKSFTIGKTYDTTIYPMIVESEVKVDWQPYQESQATLPYELNAIPVSSGGNVTIDGQQYIADYVDVERGKLVRMTELIEYDGTENWSLQSINNNGIANFQIIVTRYIGSIGMCDTFQLQKTIISNTNTEGFMINNNNSLFIRINTTRGISTLETFKEFLANKHIFILYALSTQTEIDLVKEEITAFKALSTYYPKTYVDAESEQLEAYTMFNYPVSMEKGWEYVKQQIGDTRKYVYDMDLQSAEAYVNSEYAVALTELEV